MNEIIERRQRVLDRPRGVAPDPLSRPEAIALLRERLSALCDEDQCACAAAAQWDVFCGGFRAFSDPELRDRFSWIARTRPGASRDELERLRWPLPLRAEGGG